MDFRAGVFFDIVSGEPGSEVTASADCKLDGFCPERIVATDCAGGGAIASVREVEFGVPEDKQISGGVEAISSRALVFIGMPCTMRRGQTITIKLVVPPSGKFACTVFGDVKRK